MDLFLMDRERLTDARKDREKSEERERVRWKRIFWHLVIPPVILLPTHMLHLRDHLINKGSKVDRVATTRVTPIYL